jgi:hypothetical protein
VSKSCCNLIKPYFEIVKKKKKKQTNDYTVLWLLL